MTGVRDRTNRLIDSQDQVGAWPNLKSGPTLVDTDGDGMPDEWERRVPCNAVKDFRSGKHVLFET